MRGMEQIVFLTSFIFQMFVLNVVAYNLKCPSQANWKFRAQVKCNSTLKYFCLYNSVSEQYVEGCNGPDWDRKGSKRVFAGDFSRGYCIKQRFQPFVFWTNGSVSDCIFAKSICSEKGQVVFNDNSSRDDRVCGCDYKKSYSLIHKPIHDFFCIPSEEECSCYIKSCPENYTLSADYRCKRSVSKEITKCKDIIQNNKTLDEKPEGCNDNNHLYSSKKTSKLKRDITAPAIMCICTLLIIGGFFVAVLRIENLQPMNICFHKSHTDSFDLKAGKIEFEEKASRTSTIGRLLPFNSISINNKQLCTFIDLSERYPAMILKKIISEYCILKQTTLDAILREEKHQLYHKRFKTVSCCQCTKEFTKCIHEDHWEALYEMTKVDNSHNCQSKLKECSESFVPKKNITFDRCVAEALILHIPNMLNYFISKICVMGFENFLDQNKHTINHFMENKMCCTCDKVPTGKILINETEWNSLFMKEEDIYCKSGSDYCYCQFSVRSSIEFSHVDDTLLSKLFNVAGQATFLYFLNWTIDKQPLEGVLTELLNMIADKQFVRTIRSSISSQSVETIANQFDAWKWMSKHLQIQRATTGNQYQIFVHDEDGLKVKSLQIPKDFPLPHIATKFDDLSPEENNFLLVFYGLTNIVYPVIKEAFNTKCSDPVLQEICMEIYRANKQPSAKNYDDDDNSRNKRIYLTQLQKQQLFSATGKERRNIDLKLMIHILKQRQKEDDKADDAHQLEVVDNIRREIVQSSSGVLNETRFHEILDWLQIAILHFGGGLYAGKISHLRNVKRILE